MGIMRDGYIVGNKNERHKHREAHAYMCRGEMKSLIFVLT